MIAQTPASEEEKRFEVRTGWKEELAEQQEEIRQNCLSAVHRPEKAKVGVQRGFKASIACKSRVCSIGEEWNLVDTEQATTKACGIHGSLGVHH